MRTWKCAVVALLMIASVLPLTLAVATDEGAAQARGVPKAVLGELFTATWCGYCPAADNAFNDFINNASYFNTRFTAIEWHPTQSGDVYGTSETDAVINWYGISGFPTAIFDGVSAHVGGSTLVNDPALVADYKARIDARPATSPIKLELAAYIVNGAVTYAGVNVTAVDSVAGYANLKVKAVVVEDLQTAHNNGMMRWTPRDVLFSQDLSINQGETKTFSGTGSLGGGWTTANLGVVAYVQSQTSKEVVQSIQVTSMPAITNSQPVVANAPGPISFPEDTKDTSLDLKTVFGDPEGDLLTYGFSGNSNINVTLAGSVVTLTPKKDWNGQETIHFTAKDPFNANVASVDAQVTVTAVNDPPVVKKYIADFSMLQGSQKTGLKLDDIFSDIDSKLTFTTTGNDKVSVQIGVSSPYPVTFTAADLWTGKETITFHAGDGQFDVAAMVNVTVLHTNHGPTAVAINDIVMDEDTVDTSLDLSKVFTDLDGFETLTITYENTGGHIQVAVDDQFKVTLTPVMNWNGQEVVVFTASDGMALPVQVPANVTVRSVNDAPQVVGSLERIEFDEDTIYETTGTLKSVFRDVDADPLEYTADFDPTKVDVRFNNDWTVIITPVKDFFGKLTIVFTATDPGGLSASYKCNITVDNINDQPYITAFTPTSNKSVSLNEGDNQTFSVTAVDADTDQLGYTWNLDGKLQDADGAEFDYAAGYASAGTHKLTVVVSDALSHVELTWTIKVTDVNRKPVLAIDQPLNNAEFKSGALVRLTATATDADNDKMTYKWTDNGVVIGSLPDMTLTFKSGTHLVRCEVTDGKDTVSSEVTFKVKAPAPQQSPGFEGVLLLAGIALALVVLRRRK
jgi:hypothetical protein